MSLRHSYDMKRTDHFCDDKDSRASSICFCDYHRRWGNESSIDTHSSGGIFPT